MASQDARLSKFEADFKQQQSEMTNKIDTVLKAITDRITGALPSDTVKNPKLNVNSTSPGQPQTVAKIGTQQPEEPERTLEDELQDLHLNLPVLKVLAHAPIYNAILDKYVESLELGKNRSVIVQGEMPKRMEDPGLFTLPCILGDSKSFDTLADLGSCVNIIPDVEVHIGKLKLFNDFYVIDIKKDPETPLLVGRGFLATTNAVIDYRKTKITVGEGITRSIFRVKEIDLGIHNCHLPGEWEMARDAEINPFKDVLVFRRMVEFLGALPMNLKENMWESEDLIENLINWDKPPKSGDGAWHAKIRIIDPNGEEFTKTLQSIPTSRKISKKENPREIIDLDHFHDT
ncbi:MAK10-like protein [Tanacetum coccineum]